MLGKADKLIREDQMTYLSTFLWNTLYFESWHKEQDMPTPRSDGQLPKIHILFDMR